MNRNLCGFACLRRCARRIAVVARRAYYRSPLQDPFGVWRSLVAHLLWEQGVGSSNLSTPTISKGSPLSAFGPIQFPEPLFVALSCPFLRAHAQPGGRVWPDSAEAARALAGFKCATQTLKSEL